MTNRPVRHWPNVSTSLVCILQAVYNENPWGRQARVCRSPACDPEQLWVEFIYITYYFEFLFRIERLVLNTSAWETDHADLVLG